MTKPLREAIKIISTKLQRCKVIVEVGSKQEEGQLDIADFRPFFPNSKYVGLDMRPGAGVDMVTNANNLPFKDNSVDLVLCLETFEHADKPWLLAEEIQRVVKKTGTVIVSSQQNFPIHKHPSDYFRYTPYGLSILFEKLKSKLVFTISPPFDDEVKLNPQAVVMVGTKNYNEKLLKEIKKTLVMGKREISVHKPYRHRILAAYKLLRRAIDELRFRQEIEFF